MSATGKGKGKIFVSDPHTVEGGRGKRHVNMPKMIGAGKRHISNPAYKRLARRGGVKFISTTMYQEADDLLVQFLHNVMRDCATIVESRGGKTVTIEDVDYALKRNNQSFLR